MKRRALALACAPALVMPRALAQAARQPRRIGVLAIGSVGSVGSDSTNAPYLLEGLQSHGLVRGRDFVLEERSAGGRTEGLARLAQQLALLEPSVIVSLGPQATQAALTADANVAVVAMLGDTVGSGFAAQLGRPGGRLTGVSFLSTQLNAKRLELLAGLLPRGSAVLNLGVADVPNAARDAAMDAAARSLGLVLHTAHAGTPQQIDNAFATAQRLRVAGVNVLASPFLHGNRLRIIELAAKARLPAIYQWPQSARDGGLLAYGPSTGAIHRQLAGLVARILAGARAGDLPIEQPTQFDLVINLKTARTLGLAMPQPLLLRADELIE